MNRKGDFVGVYRGGKFWPLDPRPEEVDMVAVAHSLAQICRFNGHTSFLWSVAQHSLLVESIITSFLKHPNNHRVRLLGLLHDTSEAYINDICRPVKHDLIGYKEIEEAIQNAILVHCGLNEVSEEETAIVREADNIALAVEAHTLMGCGDDWDIKQLWKNEYKGLIHYIKECSPRFVKHQFLYTGKVLMGELGLGVPWIK